MPGKPGVDHERLAIAGQAVFEEQLPVGLDALAGPRARIGESLCIAPVEELAERPTAHVDGLVTVDMEIFYQGRWFDGVHRDMPMSDRNEK